MKAQKDLSTRNSNINGEQAMGENKNEIQPVNICGPKTLSIENDEENNNPNNAVNTESNKIIYPNSPEVKNNDLSSLTNQEKVEINIHSKNLNNLNKLVSGSEIFIPQFIHKSFEKKGLTESQNVIPSKTNTFEEIYKQYSSLFDYQKGLLIGLIIGLILSVIILGITIRLYFFASKVICIAIIVLSVLAIAVFILSIVVLKMNAILIKNVIEMKDDPERITQSRERIYLYICIYLFTLIGLFFIIVGVCMVVFQTNIKMVIRAEGYDKYKWEEIYSDRSYDDVMNTVTVFLNALSTFCILFSLYIFIFCGIITYMVRSFRTRKIFIQFSCILFFQICIVFLDFALNCVKFNKVTLIERGMIHWFAGGIFGLGIIGLVSGLFGFFITIMERKKLLMIFCFLNVGMCLIFLVMNVGGASLVSKFRGYSNADCLNLYKYFDERYLIDKMDCDSKYLFVNDNIENMQCPKHRITFAWEVNEKNQIEQDDTPETEDTNNNSDNNATTDTSNNTAIAPTRKYGCINQKCCLNAYSYIKTQFDYGLVLSFVLMFSCVFLVINMGYLINNVEKTYDEGIKDKLIYLLLFVIWFAVFVLMVTFMSLVPKSPNHSRIAEFVIKDSKTSISSEEVLPIDASTFRTVTSTQFSAAQKRVKEENQYNIILKKGNSNKSISDIKFTISTTDGTLSFKSESGLDEPLEYTDEKTKTSTLTFRGDIKLINTYFDIIQFVPYAITKLLTLHVSIIGTVVDDNTLDEEIALANITGISNGGNIVIDYTKLDSDEFTFVDSKLDYSIVNKSIPVNLSGNIINYTNNVYIDVTTDYIGEYPISYTYSNDKGEFVIGPLYPLLNNEPIEYNVTFTEIDGSKNIINSTIYYQETIKIGGIGFEPSFLKFDNVTMPSLEEKTTGITYRVKGRVTDSETNENLKGTSVKIYKGNRNFNQDEHIALLRDETVGHPLFSLLTTDGFFECLVPSEGQYTVVYIKVNYYIETYVFVLSETEITIPTMAMTPVNSKGQVSFIMSWFGQTKDLDLHLKFRVEDEVDCYVFFGNRECMETYYYQDVVFNQNRGVENISINKFGQYMYMIFVHKYTDISGGVAYGEQIIEGVDPQVENSNRLDGNSEDEEGKDSVPLAEARAQIKIFAPAFKSPIAIINMPESNSANINSLKYWVAFCINGKDGLNSLKTINKITENEPDISICEDLYK